MPEKISDIYYPQNNFPQEPNFGFQSDLPEKIVSSKKKFKKNRHFLSWFLSIVFLVGLTILSYFLLIEARIEIWPEMRVVDFKEIVEINAQTESPDFSLKIFPGRKIELEMEKSQEFSASGKVLHGSKAKGIIQVYNSYSDADQVLVANTRFISADGKLFKSLDKATIPGGKYDEKGKLIPGFSDVEVVAAEAGEEYNIGPSTFSIPGFAGTPKYTAFYGKSFGAMSGGSKGEAPEVTKEDLDRAKESVSKLFFEEGKNFLISQVPSDFILLDDAYQLKITEAIPGAQAFETVAKFNYKVKGKLNAIVFKKSDLENFSKKFIFTKLTEETTSLTDTFWKEKKLKEESLKLDYKIYAIDWEKEKITLNLDFSAKVYSGIDQIALKKAIFGKSVKEVEMVLGDQPEIEKVSVKFWPFWANKIPQNLERIKLKINVD